MHRHLVPFLVIGVLVLPGCAHQRVAVAPPPPSPPPTPVVAAAMPRGAAPGMAIPVRLADGSYATPNRDLSAAASLWHWRVALNVAALACRGTQGDAIVAGYNALLTRDKAPLAEAEARYAAEFRATGAADWRDRYDDGMTRLYNFFAQAPARDAFCDAAAATLADAAFVDDAALPGFAAGRLAVLEKPFTDFYRAYDAWRDAQSPPPPPLPPQLQPIYALAATTAPGPAGVPAAPVKPAPPRLVIDPRALADDSLAH